MYRYNEYYLITYTSNTPEAVSLFEPFLSILVHEHLKLNT